MRETQDERHTFLQEFDRYCDANSVPDDKAGEAFCSFLREYGELSDVKGARVDVLRAEGK